MLTNVANRINTQPMRTEVATTFEYSNSKLNQFNQLEISFDNKMPRLDEQSNLSNYYPMHQHHIPMTPYNTVQFVGTHFQTRQQEQQQQQPEEDIKIELEDDLLWKGFAEHTNEMILTKAGRGLEDNALYTVQIEFRYADNFKYRFVNGEWRTSTKNEPTLLTGQRSSSNHLQPILYEHPDSPNFGHHWCKEYVAFSKLKLTNNENHKSSDLVFLKSLLKYEPVIHVYKHDKKNVDDRVLVFSQSFPQTSFIAVTAYQNEQITTLKIKHNPFAKAFLNNKPMITIENDRVITEQPKIKREREAAQQPKEDGIKLPYRSSPANLEPNRNELLQNWYSQCYPHNINQYQQFFQNQFKPDQREPGYNIPLTYPYYEQHQSTWNYFAQPNYVPSNAQFSQYTNNDNNSQDLHGSARFDAYQQTKRHATASDFSETTTRPIKRAAQVHNSVYQSPPLHGYANGHSSPLFDLNEANETEADDSLNSNENYNNAGHVSANNSSSNASSSSFALSTSSSL